jgi:hypothetical protein
MEGMYLHENLTNGNPGGVVAIHIYHIYPLVIKRANSKSIIFPFPL